MYSDNIVKIAELFKNLSYSEMMEIAEYYSYWTCISRNDYVSKPLVSPSTMAANLVDWADFVIAENFELEERE